MTDDELLPDYGEKLEEENKSDTKEKLESISPSSPFLKLRKQGKELSRRFDLVFLPEEWSGRVYAVLSVEVFLLLYFVLAVMGVLPSF